MSEKAAVIIGLPESGKTTYLAALWHVVTSQEVSTALQLAALGAGSKKHLNEIATRWRNAQKQDRTVLQGTRTVRMDLKDSDGNRISVTFPDVPGEEYRRMWEEREADPAVVETLRQGGVLLFAHADDVHQPNWIADENETYRQWGRQIVEGQPVEWHPRAAPTQVQLVDMLQLLRSAPLDIGPRKLAVMLSAWDKAQGEGLNPDNYLAQKMPLLNQYLNRNADRWAFRVYGLSAQGGEYDDVKPDAEKKPEAEALRQQNIPSARIDVVNGNTHSHDLTEPVAWMMA